MARDLYLARKDHTLTESEPPFTGTSVRRNRVELLFHFRRCCEQVCEHSDDPRVRWRWRLAMGVSMGFRETEISFLLRGQFQRRRWVFNYVKYSPVEFNSELRYFTGSDDIEIRS